MDFQPSLSVSHTSASIKLLIGFYAQLLIRIVAHVPHNSFRLSRLFTTLTKMPFTFCG